MGDPITRSVCSIPDEIMISGSQICIRQVVDLLSPEVVDAGLDMLRGFQTKRQRCLSTEGIGRAVEISDRHREVFLTDRDIG